MALTDDLAARLSGDATLPLVTLESGAVIGLDAAGRWVFTSGDARVCVFGPETSIAFGEVLEQARDGFEDSLAQAARAAEISAEDVLDAFPAVPLVRAVLAKEFAYMTRLALLWIRPSELRELRADIVRVAGSDRTPGPIRDLAKRLVVPEAQR